MAELENPDRKTPALRQAAKAEAFAKVIFLEALLLKKLSHLTVMEVTVMEAPIIWIFLTDSLEKREKMRNTITKPSSTAFYCTTSLIVLAIIDIFLNLQP